MATGGGLSVDVIAPYPFHLHAAAREFARLGALRRLLTCYPPRFVPGVDRPLMEYRPALAAIRRAVGRRVPASDRLLNRLVLGDFERWAAGRTGGRVAIASSGLATRAIAAAQAHGSTVVSDRGCWHMLEQKQVFDDEADRWGWPRTRFDNWLVERELAEYEFADLITVPSEPALQSFRRRGIAAGRLAKVPYGVDTEAFFPGDRPDPNRVICVAEVALHKGHQYLVPAYRSVRSPSTSLVLVGRCSADARRRLNLDESGVDVMGALPRTRVAEELRRSAIFVLASVHDGLALVIAQAMASGVAVIASDATGAAELITDGKDGIIVRAGDARALEAALSNLLSDPDRARAMGQAARARIVRSGGWREYGERLLQALNAAARA